MPLYLRKVRKQRWVQSGASSPGGGEIPADPLADLNTNSNALSVFLIDSEQGNLEKIVVALAATSEFTDKPVDFLLFDESLPSALEIHVVKSAGNTPDDEVNSNWHYEFEKLTANDVNKLVVKLWDNPRVGRKLKMELLPLIRDAVQSGQMARERLSSKWKEEIGD